jgi:hypothetical protein
MVVGRADLDAMLADRDEDEAERGAGVRFFTVPVGRTYVRILPPHEEANGRTIVKGGVHWIGGRSISCPAAFRVADECWLCNRAQELYDSGNEDDRKEAAALAMRVRFHANIVTPNDLDTGIQVWEFGRQVYDQIMRYIADPDYGDISDPEDGYDLIVEREGSGRKTRYNIRARKSPSALAPDVIALIEEDPDSLKDLRNLRPFLTDEEMQAGYEGESDEIDEEDEEDERRPAAKRRTSTTTAKTRKAPPVEEEEEEEEDNEPEPRAREDRPKVKPRVATPRPTARPATRPGRPIGKAPEPGSASATVAGVLQRRAERRRA